METMIKPGAQLRGVNLTCVYFDKPDLCGADLREANMYRCNLQSANLAGADLERANLSEADLEFANLVGARLYSANLEGAVLINANLMGAHLSGSSLRGADLRGADLRGAKLDGSMLQYTDLRDTNLEGASLHNTVLDPAITKRNRRSNIRQKGLILYRSADSPIMGGPRYEVGKTYVAPVFSHCPITNCHPGIYAGTLKAARKHLYEPELLVYVRAGEYVTTGKGFVRCERIRVLKDLRTGRGKGQ